MRGPGLGRALSAALLAGRLRPSRQLHFSILPVRKEFVFPLSETCFRTSPGCQLRWENTGVLLLSRLRFQRPQVLPFRHPPYSPWDKS